MSERLRRALALCLLAAIAATLFALKESAVPASSPGQAALPLLGRVIGVDAGHGGYDGGCVGVSGEAEKTYNLALALCLGRELEELGATVVYTRTEDIALIDPAKTTGYKKRKELDNRLKRLAEGGAEMMLSIHMNKYRNANQRGAQVFYKSGSPEGEALAASVWGSLFAAQTPHLRKPSTGDYYILNACAASLLVECGFISNAQEEKLLADPAYQKKLAKALAQGVAEYALASPAVQDA